MDELVSIVIPIYNSGKYIDYCIQSVRKQTYSPIEILLIDDGSTDGCGEKCDAYALVDERIKVIHKTNGGVSSARNAGIHSSSGSYITFIDSDDTIDPGMIDAMVSLYEQQKSDLVVTALQKDPARPTSAVIAISPAETEWICYLLEHFLLFGPCQKLYSLDRIHCLSVEFPENMSYGEDLVFNLDYLAAAEKISFLNKSLYHYNRDNTSSLSQRIRWDMFENDMLTHRKLQAWLQDKNLWNLETSRILYGRVIDTAYNSINLAFKSHSPWKGKERRRYFNSICSDPMVEESIWKGNTNKYAPWIISAIKHKQILTLEVAAWIIGRRKR